MYTYTYIYIYICVYMFIYMSICLYIYNFFCQHRMSILTTTNFLGNIFDSRASPACCTALGLQRFESSLCNNTSLVASRAREPLKITPLSHSKYWLVCKSVFVWGCNNPQRGSIITYNQSTMVFLLAYLFIRFPSFSLLKSPIGLGNTFHFPAKPNEVFRVVPFFFPF